MNEYFAAIYHIVWKDIVVETRTKQITTTAAMFALLVVLAFAFNFVKTLENPQIVGRGALWIAFIFSGTIGVTKTIGIENQNAALDGLLLAPVDRSAIYVAKVISTALFVLVVDGVTLGAAVVFLGYSPAPTMVLPLIGILAMAALGFSAVGMVISTLTFRSNLDELVIPVLLIPLVVPLLLSGVGVTDALARGMPTGSWLRVLFAYAGILFLAGLVTFEFIVEE